MVQRDSTPQGDDCCGEKLDALEKEIVRRDEDRKREIDRRLGDSQWRTDLFLTIAGLLIGFVTLLVALFGRRALVGWIQQSISEKTEDLATKHLQELKSQGDEAVSAHLDALEIAAKEKLEGLEKARNEYEKLRNALVHSIPNDETGRTITSAHGITRKTSVSHAIPQTTANQLLEFESQLMALKGENSYTAKDWFLRGVAASGKGDCKAAIEYFTKSIKLDPTRTKSYNNRGNALQRLGRYEEAMGDYDNAVKVDPMNATALANKAGLLGIMGDDDGSFAVAKLAISIDPNQPMAYLNRGVTFSGQGRHDEAIKDYSRAIDLDSELALAYCNRGTSLKIQGNLDGSLSDYSRAIELDPEFAGAYNGRGNTLKAMDRDREALNDYNEAIRLSPKMAVAYMNRGLLYQALGCLREALTDFEHSLVLEPGDSAILLMMAEVAIQLDNYEAATKRATEALSVSRDPEERALSLYLKIVSEKLQVRDTSATEAEFEEALQEDFETAWSTAEIESWLEEANISDETRKFIRAKTKLLKLKQKKA